ncbi:hypothetical protein PHYPO_G00087290 [Pangasianodon hypophthalmus]|uniref:Uncharacterized protein n=1 Tax=Pangasianodon hypophthalmus TaxID=310915 RepID=A0A5N5LIT7_PANHP|nr:hypothetical protein PHYPO_G00087290 [Pangasianodon hypophthalmus]
MCSCCCCSATNTDSTLNSTLTVHHGDRRTAGHIRQHAGSVTVPAGGALSLRGCQQPEEARMIITSRQIRR